MAADRRSGDDFPVTRRLAAASLLLALVPGRRVSAQGITLNDEIISDPNSGAALYGFDVVAYFLEQRAVPGRTEIQAIHAGKVWYFVSRANKDAFLRGPDAFIPVFGGHDPLGIAAGFAVAGDPQTFTVADNRLLLFRDAASRALLLREPARMDLANRNWPLVRRDMVP